MTKSNYLVIDANPGLGEAVVGKRSKHVKEQRLGRREVIIRAKAGGGTEQIAPLLEGLSRAALPSPAIRKLSQLGILIDQHYGAPQDIEWAWVKDGTKNRNAA